MTSLSPQKLRIIELYKDGQWHCSVEITFIRDYRKRLSEMNHAGFVFESRICDGRCGVKHNANVHMYRLTERPVQKKWVYELVDGVRVPKQITL